MRKPWTVCILISNNRECVMATVVRERYSALPLTRGMECGSSFRQCTPSMRTQTSERDNSWDFPIYVGSPPLALCIQIHSHGYICILGMVTKKEARRYAKQSYESLCSFFFFAALSSLGPAKKAGYSPSSRVVPYERCRGPNFSFLKGEAGGFTGFCMFISLSSCMRPGWIMTAAGPVPVRRSSAGSCGALLGFNGLRQ